MTHQPNTLAIELSQRQGSIAMSNSAGKSVMYEVETSRRDEDKVMPSIALAAKDLCVSPSELELVVVSIGPGGFTGLRTAVAFAKMISYATKAKVIPVESAIVVAAFANRGNGPFLVVASVKQDNCWLSRVEFCDHTWICEAKLASISDINQHTEGIVAVFADQFLPAAALEGLRSNNIPLLQSAWDASTLLEIGQHYAEQGKSIDPLALLPLYPREPEAVLKWNSTRRGN